MKVGTRINLATHKLTKHFGLGGTGTVTAIRDTDPVNHYQHITIKTKTGYINVDGEGRPIGKGKR